MPLCESIDGLTLYNGFIILNYNKIKSKPQKVRDSFFIINFCHEKIHFDIRKCVN